MRKINNIVLFELYKGYCESQKINKNDVKSLKKFINSIKYM